MLTYRAPNDIMTTRTIIHPPTPIIVVHFSERHRSFAQLQILAFMVNEMNLQQAQTIIVSPYLEGFRPFQDVYKHPYMSYIEGSELTFFANLYHDENEFQIITNLIKRCENDAASIEKFFDSVKSEINQNYDDLTANVIVIDGLNLSKKAKMNSTEYYGTQLINNLRALTLLADSLVQAALEFDTEKGKTVIPMVINEFAGAFSHSIHYGVLSGLLNGKIHLQPYYVISRAQALLELDFVQAFQGQKQIKICENCGKYFIPNVRSDEKYCDNIFKNGKTCKQLGYEIKVNANEISREYRKIYKTQNMRKQRKIQKNENRKMEIEEKFSKWFYTSKAILRDCEDGKISIDEMSKQLNDSEWLDGGI